MKIALVSDTTATLDQAVIEKYAIHTVPLTITIDGKSYREQEDLTNKEFYQLLKKVTRYQQVLNLRQANGYHFTNA